MMDILEMYDRVDNYWREHSAEIDSATEGYNYILKMLYKSFNFNSRASGRTVTCKTAHDTQVEHERQRYLEISRDSLAAAICELLDQDYERRLEEADDEVIFL